jgi:hypothetical protein
MIIYVVVLTVKGKENQRKAQSQDVGQSQRTQDEDRSRNQDKRTTCLIGYKRIMHKSNKE